MRDPAPRNPITWKIKEPVEAASPAHQPGYTARARTLPNGVFSQKVSTRVVAGSPVRTHRSRFRFQFQFHPTPERLERHTGLRKLKPEIEMFSSTPFDFQLAPLELLRLRPGV